MAQLKSTNVTGNLAVTGNINCGKILENGNAIATQDWVYAYLNNFEVNVIDPSIDALNDKFANYQPKGNYLTSHAYRPLAVDGETILSSSDSAQFNLEAGDNISLSGTIGEGVVISADVPSVVNNLTSTSTTSSLSAAQGKALNDKFASYLPLSGGSLNSDATLKFTKYGTRTVTISGNSIDADMSADTGTWAGNFATVKHSKGTTTMLGWYGSKGDGLYSIFMGGSYSDPAMKMDASGNFTFKNTITGTITNATQLGGVAASSYATTSSLSNYLPKVGGELSGTLTLPVNKPQIQFRSGHASYDGVISYGTDGNEAMVFSTKNAVTSFMFVNGEDTVTNVSGGRWKSLTPGLQIKNNCVSIGKLIANDVTPTYKLDVNGSLNATTIYENGTTLSNKYQAKLTSGTNIKTINGTSLLGSGNISISGGSGAVTKVWSGSLSLDDGVISDAYNNCTYALLIIYSNDEDAYGFLLGQQYYQRQWVFTGTMKQPGGDSFIIDFEDADGQFYSNTLSVTDCEVYAVYNIGG